jgi:hypothetical protein
MSRSGFPARARHEVPGGPFGKNFRTPVGIEQGIFRIGAARSSPCIAFIHDCVILLVITTVAERDLYGWQA